MFLRALIAVALISSLAGQARPMAGYLRHWWRSALRTTPEQLRQELSPVYRESTEVVDFIERNFPPGEPVLLRFESVAPWFVALGLQPRYVYVDRPAARKRLARAREPHLLVALEGTDEELLWTVEHDDASLILRDGFEEGLGSWKVRVGGAGE